MVRMMGLKNPKVISDKEIIKYSDKFNIPLEDSYKLDTAYYSYLFSLDTIQFKNEIQDHYQPLQALYYHKNKLVSYQVNCYAGGFPKLDWNKDGIFDTFPPKQQAPLDSIFTSEQYLNYLIPLSGNKLTISNYQYVVFVHWSRFMNKQSKHFIQVVQENSKLSKKESVKIIYINNDSFFGKTIF
jgi:hypothetical protein